MLYLGKMVEVGDLREIYAHPLHPYTQALLAAVPVPNPQQAAYRADARRRDPQPDQPTLRLPLPPALPLRHRACARQEPVLRELRPGPLGCL